MKEDLTPLALVQMIGWSTVGTDCNEGYSLPLEISKKIAIACIKELCPASKEVTEFINEIEKL
jgi:hypothetical protein